MGRVKTTTTRDPRAKLRFRGVSMRLSFDEELRLDALAIALGIPAGLVRAGRRGKAAKRALLAGIDALEAELASKGAA